MSVIAAFELDDVFALCIAARQTNCRHGRFRARTDEANFLHVRESGNYQLGKIGFGGSGGPEAGAVAGRLDHGFDHRGLGVAEDERAPGADVVDIFVAVGVPNVRALAAHDVERVAAYTAESADRRIYASGNQFFSALLEFARLFGLAGHRSSFLRGSGHSLR